MVEENMTNEICDRCKKEITISVAYFEQAMKDGEPVLCAECMSTWMDEQTATMPKRCFEYKIEELGKIQHLAVLNKAGLEGWELVSVDGGVLYFKREYMKEGK